MPKSRKKQNSKVVMEQKRRSRRFLNFRRILKYGFKSFIRNSWLSAAATAVMTITLLVIFGSFIMKNIVSSTVGEIKDRLDYSIYLNNDTKPEAAEEIKRSLEALSSVDYVKLTNPADAKQNAYNKSSKDEAITRAYRESTNEFYWIVNINMKDVSNKTELLEFARNDKLIQANISKTAKPTFEGDRQKTIDTIANSANFAEKIGVFVAILFVAISGLIIFNTIRMATFDRREEIYMMKLIGANKSFITGPFLVESVICGILAGFFATGIGYWVMSSIRQKLEGWFVVDSTYLILERYWFLIIPAILMVGSIIGIISSFAATRKYLKI